MCYSTDASSVSTVTIEIILVRGRASSHRKVNIRWQCHPGRCLQSRPGRLDDPSNDHSRHPTVLNLNRLSTSLRMTVTV